MAPADGGLVVWRAGGGLIVEAFLRRGGSCFAFQPSYIPYNVEKEVRSARAI
jgi:hypothetical protein